MGLSCFCGKTPYGPMVEESFRSEVSSFNMFTVVGNHSSSDLPSATDSLVVSLTRPSRGEATSKG